MRNVLVVVDASDKAATAAALAQAVRMHAEEPIDVHLLNVQPPVSGHVAMFFGDKALQELHESAGAEELAPALALLRSHNMRCSVTVRVGRRAETIASAARELGCDRIVLGREGDAAGFASKVFGSLAQQVRQLVHGTGDCQVIGA